MARKNRATRRRRTPVLGETHRVHERWEALARWAEVVGRDLQPWPSYFGFRARELSTALKTRTSHRDVLEIGCGVGFTSAILGTPGRRVLALDLPRADAESHTIGMDSAKELRRRLELPNPPMLVAGDGSRLPLPDHSVDLVVSVYVLEHIPDREAVCREIRRVLRPGGEAIILVPGAAERLWAPIWYYLHTIREVAASVHGFFSRRRAPERGSPQNSSARERGTVPVSAPVARGWGFITHFRERFRHHYPRFPAVPPHGMYAGWWDEFRSCRGAAWRRLFESSGLVVVEHRASMLAPVALLDEFGPRFRERVTRLLHGTTSRRGRNRLLRSMACGCAWRLVSVPEVSADTESAGDLDVMESVS